MCNPKFKEQEKYINQMTPAIVYDYFIKKMNLHDLAVKYDTTKTTVSKVKNRMKLSDAIDIIEGEKSTVILIERSSIPKLFKLLRASGISYRIPTEKHELTEYRESSF